MVKWAWLADLSDNTGSGSLSVAVAWVLRFLTMSRKQSVRPRPGKKAEVERKRDERAARRALVKERKNRAGEAADPEEFVSFTNQLQVLGLRMREVPGDGSVAGVRGEASAAILLHPACILCEEPPSWCSHQIVINGHLGTPIVCILCFHVNKSSKLGAANDRRWGEMMPPLNPHKCHFNLVYRNMWGAFH